MWPLSASVCVEREYEARVDEDMAEEIKALSPQPGTGIFDHDGLMAEANCRHRGRRLCTMDELQHWAQCFQARFGDNAPPLSLGCYRPLPTQEEEPDFRFKGLYVRCEFTADMFPTSLAEPSDVRHGIVGATRLHGLGHPIPDARGYAQLRFNPNDNRECGGGLVGARCCLDL